MVENFFKTTRNIWATFNGYLLLGVEKCILRVEGNEWDLTNNALIDGIRGAILGSWSASVNKAVEGRE
jgi:hypothetical protein